MGRGKTESDGQEEVLKRHGTVQLGTYFLGRTLAQPDKPRKQICWVCFLLGKDREMILWIDPVNGEQWWHCHRESHDDRCDFAYPAGDKVSPLKLMGLILWHFVAVRYDWANSPFPAPHSF